MIDLKELKTFLGKGFSKVTIQRKQQGKDLPTYSVVAEISSSRTLLVSGQRHEVQTYLNGLILVMDELAHD